MVFLHNNIVAWLTTNWRWLLVLSVLPLLTDNAIYNLPLIIMALLGITCLIRYREHLWQRLETRYLLLIFAALWLPQLIALIDAVQPQNTLRIVLHYTGYLFAAMFITISLSERDLHRLTGGILVVLAVWFIDTLLAWGGFERWLGYTTAGVRVSGILFTKLTLGHIVATLSPLVFDYLRRNPRRLSAWLLQLGAVVIVMLSGRRVAWFMLGIAGIGYASYMVCVLRNIRPTLLAYAAILCIIIPAGLYNYYPPFHDRIETSLGLFSDDSKTIDKATSHRLDIWSTAINVGSNHWFNGIGSRGFRHVYAEHASTGDFWINERQGSPTHPHQFVLEILAETGLIGLSGYCLSWYILLLTLRYRGGQIVWPYTLALGVALFPLNAHMAFYGSYWSALIWWLIGIVFATAGRCSQHQALDSRITS